MKKFIFILFISFLARPSKAISLLEQLTPQENTFKSLNLGACSSALDSIQIFLDRLNWDQFGNDSLLLEAQPIRNLLWHIRLSIHQQLPIMNQDCVLKARRLFHSLRDADDFLSEFSDKATPLDPAEIDFQMQPTPLMNRSFYPGTHVANEQPGSEFEFRDGDIMLARGFSFLSAIISQISNNQDHFSHAIMVSVKNDGKNIKTTESYIGSGVKNYEIEYALKNENVRLMVLRSKDPQLAILAADAALKAGEKRVPYDYKMDFNDDTQMSCVEVPTYAFKIASGRRLQIPMYPAQLNLKKSEFLERLGLKDGPLITPDDLETDPRFDLVLDWQDARLIRDSREKDAVLSEILRWIGTLNYQFRDDWNSYFAMYVLLPLRHTFLWPFVQKIPHTPNIDAHIPRSTLGIMAILNQTADTIQKELRKEDEAQVAKQGRPFTNAQLRLRLEVMRVSDLQNYRDGKLTLFHKHLRPQNL